MPLLPPYASLSEVQYQIGEAGHHLAAIGASEAAAGNISVLMGWPVPDVEESFPVEEAFDLPGPSHVGPQLAGSTIVITGSGRRLREIEIDPHANLGVIRIAPDGKSAVLNTAQKRRFARPTSELNTHLSVHSLIVATTGTNFHAVVHAQPLHIVYLSHLAQYADHLTMNHRILRWQPESIANLPTGVAVLPYTMPGSKELAATTTEAMKNHSVALWSKHGLIARADSVKRAVDLMEYAETGARYEYLNLINGDGPAGLTTDEIYKLCAAFNIDQKIF